MNTSPYRRYNLLQDKWVLTSPQRFNRPWSGQVEDIKESVMPEYDPKCYLCPENIRNNGEINPNYKECFTFVNDFSALIPNLNVQTPDDSTFFMQQNEPGICEVICYTPTHNKTMSSMSIVEISKVIETWRDRYIKLGTEDFINHVQIFENRGSEVGNSNPHPHGQIWAQMNIPSAAKTEIGLQTKYFESSHSVMLLDYAEKEIKEAERVIFKNNFFISLVPFWAEWPYETLILPTFNIPSLKILTDSQSEALAEILSLTAKTYGKLFNRPLYGAPYTMGLHQQPTDGKDYPGYQMHFHFHPPLLTPSRQKFMTGYERFGEAQRDLTAEQAASQLKEIAQNI